jgi:hypothetical protein
MVAAGADISEVKDILGHRFEPPRPRIIPHRFLIGEQLNRRFENHGVLL